VTGAVARPPARPAPSGFVGQLAYARRKKGRALFGRTSPIRNPYLNTALEAAIPHEASFFGGRLGSASFLVVPDKTDVALRRLCEQSDPGRYLPPTHTIPTGFEPVVAYEKSAAFDVRCALERCGTPRKRHGWRFHNIERRPITARRRDVDHWRIGRSGRGMQEGKFHMNTRGSVSDDR
jgi:hypothetical protein